MNALSSSIRWRQLPMRIRSSFLIPDFFPQMLRDCPFWTSRTEGSMLYTMSYAGARDHVPLPYSPCPISFYSTSSPDLSQECQEPDPRRSHPDPAHSGGREGGKVRSPIPCHSRNCLWWTGKPPSSHAVAAVIHEGLSYMSWTAAQAMR